MDLDKLDILSKLKLSPVKSNQYGFRLTRNAKWFNSKKSFVKSNQYGFRPNSSRVRLVFEYR